MKYRFLLLLFVLSILCGCVGLRESAYTKYNAFQYLPEVDTNEHKSWGRNNEYQFQLYAKPPYKAKANLWTMKVIASNTVHSHNFVYMVDSSFVTAEDIRLGQQRQFLEDIKRFAT